MPHCLLRLAYSINKIQVLKKSPALVNFYSSSSIKVSQNETRIQNILNSHFPKAKLVDVKDISGGCGAMYEIYVEAPQFKGLSIVKQHKLVTEALKEEIKEMHGLRIHTSPA